MDSASSGDTLLLLPGTYLVTRAIVVKGGVVITSQAGPATTIVERADRASSQGVFFFLDASPPPTLEGLTIAHGWEVRGFPGGGLVIRNSSPLIQNNLIVANTNGDIEGGNGFGCGIGVDGGSPVIRHNTVAGNLCDLGGIDLYRCSAVVEFNIVAYTGTDSSRASGMGISCGESPGATIQNNLFWANKLADIDPHCATEASLDSNVVANPLFCHPIAAPGDALLGDWRVQDNSPVAPGGPQAGWGAALGLCAGDTPSFPTSWGKLKATYRN